MRIMDKLAHKKLDSMVNKIVEIEKSVHRLEYQLKSLYGKQFDL